MYGEKKVAPRMLAIRGNFYKNICFQVYPKRFVTEIKSQAKNWT